jgi:tryptophan 2,3-dioxygenase
VTPSPPLPGPSYGVYLRVPELLHLQKTLSDPPHHDETLFIIIHQVYELWFKQVLHEVDTAIMRLGRGDIAEATRLLRRVVEIERVLTAQLKVLETMRPQDFIGFRYHLNPASGFQSVQFRELEFVLGIKNERLMSAVMGSEAEMSRLRSRFAAPSIGDALDDVLRQRGLLHAGGDRLEAFIEIYRSSESHPDLNALCEVLIEIDENLAQWRALHVLMVARMIGEKRGTGGSEGVPYLKSTLEKRAFPDLWKARGHLGEPSA